MSDLFEESDASYNFRSLEMFRDSILVACSKVITGEDFGMDAVPEDLKPILTLQEVETVLRDAGIYEENGVFAIGGDTKEEAAEKVGAIVRALSMRVISNAMASGVSRGLLDCEFDTDTNDFAFQVTDKGRQIAKEYGYEID